MTRDEQALLVLGLLAILVLIAGSLFDSTSVVQGWLVAFVFWSGIPIGSLVLLLVHRLVGGSWGYSLRPTLTANAMQLPAVALAFVPVLFAMHSLFPWAANGSAAAPDVARYYLNAAAFSVRASIALGGWIAIAVVCTRYHYSTLFAGLALAFYGLMISLVSVDWILSVDPRFTSSAFPAGIAVQQVLSALAFAGLAGGPRRDPSTNADLAGLLMTALLSVVYLDFMSYVVVWYGNLPEKAGWYVERSSGAWTFVIAAAVISGAILPFSALLSERVRTNDVALRVISAFILFGVCLHTFWLLLPAFRASATLWCCVAIIGLTALSTVANRRMAIQMRRAHA
jgi:hypothetical protein